MPKPLAIRSEIAGRTLARLHALHYWPFKDKQFAQLIQEAEEGEIEMLGYCAIASSDEDFKKRIERLYNAKFPNPK